MVHTQKWPLTPTLDNSLQVQPKTTWKNNPSNYHILILCRRSYPCFCLSSAGNSLTPLYHSMWCDCIYSFQCSSKTKHTHVPLPQKYPHPWAPAHIKPFYSTRNIFPIYWVPLQTAAVKRQGRKAVVHLSSICSGGSALPLPKALLQPLEKYCTFLSMPLAGNPLLQTLLLFPAHHPKL